MCFVAGEKLITKPTLYRHATSSEGFAPTFPSRGRHCFACLSALYEWLPLEGKLFAFLEDFYFKYPFGIFFSFQFFISFSKTENSFCGRFFFLRCSFASVVRSVLSETSCVMKYFWKNGAASNFSFGIIPGKTAVQRHFFL